MAFSCRAIARAFSTSSKTQRAVSHVAIVGSGLMGRGLAQVAAQTGHHVTVAHRSEATLQERKEIIQTALERFVKKEFKEDQQNGEKFLVDALGRITHTMDIREAASRADIVLEAVKEDIDLKKRLLEEIDHACQQQTVLVTVTSSLSIQELARAVSRPDRFGALHFFNPVQLIKLVEVVRIPETSDETHQTMMDFTKNMGKTSVQCKDTPGFIVNRLMVPYLMEAVRMLERGDASARDIDLAMKLGAGYPMGPIELLDHIGLDVYKSIVDGWHKTDPEEPLFKPNPRLDDLVSQGKLGVKTGQGFYSYK